jgi:hypothetical protein
MSWGLFFLCLSLGMDSVKDSEIQSIEVKYAMLYVCLPCLPAPVSTGGGAAEKPCSPNFWCEERFIHGRD